VTATLLLATTNPGKAREYCELFVGLPVRLVSPPDLGFGLDVEETGATFRANADLKARAYAARAAAFGPLWTLAEDAGLEVSALGGEPGVYSARWGGEDYTAKNALLLARLAAVPDTQRGCRYVCAVTLVSPAGRLHRCRGEVRGRIAHAARGSGGFGYDPVFLVMRLGRTMAELEPAEKHALSHRAQAARCVRTVLTAALGEAG
jgi:XTP/dITP diphosphohydrolase